MDHHAPAGSYLEAKPQSPNRPNRRAGIRRKVSGAATAHGYTMGGAVQAPVRLVDASAHGIGLDSPVPFEVGTEIRLHFNDQPIAGRTGLVARCDEHAQGYRVGIDMDAAVAA